MALRWLVRRDGIVDIGCWSALKPSTALYPARRTLGQYLARTRAALHAARTTARLLKNSPMPQRLPPRGPVIYDFALFGFGVNQASL